MEQRHRRPGNPEQQNEITGYLAANFPPNNRRAPKLVPGKFQFLAESLYDVVPTDTRTPYDVREVIARAIALGATALIIVHNHPSGDARPSDSDCRATRRLVAAVEPLDCAVLDHLIFAGDDCTSLRQLGYL